MHHLVAFAIFGIGIGGVYGLLGNGLVLIYRGSGVVNFAHGAMAMSAAYIFYEFNRVDGWPFWPAFLVSISIVTGVGIFTQLAIMRRLRNASPISRLIATLGVLAILDGLFSLWFATAPNAAIPPSLPHGSFHVGGFAVSQEAVSLFGIAAAICVALHLWSRYAPMGLAMVAVAESSDAAASLGWSPQTVATITWAGGAALAAIAGVLIVPVSGLNITNLTLIVVDALAAALLGGFLSFPIVLAAGLAIGIVQSEMAYFVSQPGWAETVPFIAIILVLLVRGRGLPVRGHVLERLPRVGSGRFRPLVVLPVTAVLALCIATFFPQNLTIAVTVQIAVATVLLSIVVVTGYAGQLSLAQFCLAGIGALVAGRLAAVEGWPFLACLVCGALAAAAVGVVVGIPALRTRGVNLAIVTLGLGLALEDLVFLNPDYTGGVGGTSVQPPTFFGLSLNPVTDPKSYAIFCLAVFVVVVIVVSNIRRSRSGRRLVAVRANERAAASLGISVTGSKLYAFALSAGIAGVGGVLLDFMNPVLQFTTFGALTSADFVGYATIGGLGHITGPLFGSGFQAGGIGSLILNQFSAIDTWLPLIGGIVLVAILLQNPDGIAGAPTPALVRWIRSKLGRHLAEPGHDVASDASAAAAGSASLEPALAAADSRRVRTEELSVRGVTVRFGGVVAVNDVSLSVRPGEVVGLIGPNGAGKTTMIDAITGFVPVQGGSIRLGERSLDRMPAYRRARCGVMRTFQSLELFEDFSVEDNFLVASDKRDKAAYFANLVYRGRASMGADAVGAIAQFDLTRFLGRSPRDLPYGVRRLLGIARAIAAGPAILLLDEPASGLDDTETAELARLIRHLSREGNIGVLLVEHDMTLVMDVCDRITVLDFGTQIAEGTPDEVRKNATVIDAYLGAASSSGRVGVSDELKAQL